MTLGEGFTSMLGTRENPNVYIKEKGLRPAYAGVGAEHRPKTNMGQVQKEVMQQLGGRGRLRNMAQGDLPANSADAARRESLLHEVSGRL